MDDTIILRIKFQSKKCCFIYKKKINNDEYLILTQRFFGLFLFFLLIHKNRIRCSDPIKKMII